MTREEAIQICKEVRHCLWIADEQKTTTIWDKGAVSEAMLMAIEALKQVTGKLNNTDDSLLTADSEVCKEQKSKLDLISRADAIEALGEEPLVWCDEEYEIAERDQWRADIEAIKSVPSADRPRPIEPTITVDLESGVVPISACEPKGPKTIIYADRPKGEWIEINNGADTTCECSECHHRDYIPNEKTKQNKYECMDRYWFERNFCPNCGADMRGDTE